MRPEFNTTQQPQTQPVDTPPRKTKRKKTPIIILLAMFALAALGLAGWKWYGQTQEYKENKNDAEKRISQLEQELNSLKKEKDNDSETKQQSTVKEDFFTITLPSGFEKKQGAREFQFTGAPQQHYTYINNQTGEYFEVNIAGEGSGVNPDYAWIYTYSGGKITLQKTTTEVCDKSDELCSSAEDGRLDVFIKNQNQSLINGRNIYFTFGNTKTEQPGSVAFVDEFISNLQFN